MEYANINEEVRNRLIRTVGTYMQCVSATKELVANTNLTHWAGFCDGFAHHWAQDPQTGTIYDPTMEQFGLSWCPAVPVGDPLYELYKGTPLQEVRFWAYSSSGSLTTTSHLARYLRFKEIVGSPSETRGQEMKQVRVAKNGNSYLLMQKQVTFTSVDCGKQMRSATIWRARKGGYNIYVLMQRCVETKTGKFIFPVSREVYYLPKVTDKLIPRRKGKWGKAVQPPPWHPLAELVRAARQWG